MFHFSFLQFKHFLASIQSGVNCETVLSLLDIHRMNVPLDTRHAPSHENGDAYLLSNPSQSITLYNLPSPPSQCFVVHTPIEASSAVNFASPAMTVTNNGTLVLFVPFLDYSQQQSCQTYQFEYQHIGLDPEYFPCNLSEPQTLDNNMWMATATSQATPPSELPTMANGGITTSTFISPTIIRSQTQSPTSPLIARYSPPYPLSPEADQGLQAPACHQSQRPACPLPHCGTTFKRTHELKRHIATVHGLKKNCPYNPCRYKTGRKDKMVEHERKMHGKA
ncbi:hypothetical protein V8E51_007425 [Hyaloscypha variabilis]